MIMSLRGIYVDVDINNDNDHTMMKIRVTLTTLTVLKRVLLLVLLYDISAVFCFPCILVLSLHRYLTSSVA